METNRKLPKSAVTQLIEHCEKTSEKEGVSAAELFKYYLGLMNKYADYFFQNSWEEEHERLVNPHSPFILGEEQQHFIDTAKRYVGQCERFTVVCLRANVSLSGFDSEGFAGDFHYFGKLACWNCVVTDAMWLREHTKLVEEDRKSWKDKAKAENPSWMTVERMNYYNRPEVIREDKMELVKLRFLEEYGFAEGRSCKVENMYQCPYPKDSLDLIEAGATTRRFWKFIEFYNYHWNRSSSYSPGESDLKWYHYDEPGIIDVTDFDDILRSLHDGRFKKIREEWEKYEKETRSENSSN